MDISARVDAREILLSLDDLTPREREVFNLLGAGLSNKEAGILLHLSPRTIEVHRDRVCQKLGLRNAIELGRAAAYVEIGAASMPSRPKTGREERDAEEIRLALASMTERAKKSRSIAGQLSIVREMVVAAAASMGRPPLSKRAAIAEANRHRRLHPLNALQDMR